MRNWTHRLCERCWFDARLDDGATFGMAADGSYRKPVQIVDPEPGICCFCAGVTVTGIYVRADPDAMMCQGQHTDLSWSGVRPV